MTKLSPALPADRPPVPVAPSPSPAQPPAAPLPADPRPKRSDARRNRDRLIAAATEAFTTRGVDTALEDVAQRADVGIGTLYRHFPTRSELIEAVYRSELERLCDAADSLLAERPPDQALAEWMQRFVAHVATKRGMADALKAAAACGESPSELFAYARQRVHVAAGRLLDAAAAEGTVRGDVDPADLMRAISGICLGTDLTGSQDQARRLVALLMDGLRYTAAAPRVSPS